MLIDISNNMEQPTEMFKMKKHRRGKRKSKSRPEKSDHECQEMGQGGCAICSDIAKNIPGQKRMKMLRPHCSPKAPENYTQFLIEDKYPLDLGVFLDVQFAGNFTPERRSMESIDLDDDDDSAIPTPSTSPSSMRVPGESSPDMDTFYESEETLGQSDSFANKDFEDVFNSVREDTLFERERAELVFYTIKLEERLSYLQTRLGNSEEKNEREQQVIVKTLAEEHAELLEENVRLREENELLRKNLSNGHST